MNIKTKLTLGIGILFLLITLLSGLSVWYIHSLKRDTKKILAANYNTLFYSGNMLRALDELKTRPDALTVFKNNLAKQQINLTEEGEGDLTAQLSEHFKAFEKHSKDAGLLPLIRSDIMEIMRLNMNAIIRKSNIAADTADNAMVWAGVTGATCFIIAFTLLINLPGNIANPIGELTASIKQIAAHNYRERVHFEGHSEFGELARSFNTMASKLEEYAGSNLSKILMEKKRIDTLINNMQDVVIGLDEQLIVLFANDEALKVLGLEKEKIVGKAITDVAKYNDLTRLLIKDINNQSAKKVQEPIKIFANDKESYFEKELLDISIVPAGELTKQHIGYVILLKNITPFRELDLAKTNFIATVSHELKTPIASIKMSLQLLNNEKTGQVNQDQKYLLESIKEDSDRLLRITGELLNMSQVETGNIQLNLQTCDPMQIINYAIEATKISAGQKNIHINVITTDDLPRIKADVEKTAWVLTNFLSNAIRYAPEQSEISLSLLKDNDYLVFSVRDYGQGIDKRYQQRIFERYFQIPGSSKSGTGLGLAISKDFIEAQGGEIGVESALGQGSMFYFKVLQVA
ncbi:MAG TPA: ATP-binding protein [Pseudosphingobacterium sp.]|nr:ATP-binding protein [Pseudosphingobacterium sp.]